MASTPSVNWTASSGKRGGAEAVLAATTVVAAGVRDAVVPLTSCADATDRVAEAAVTARQEIFIALTCCVWDGREEKGGGVR